MPAPTIETLETSLLDLTSRAFIKLLFSSRRSSVFCKSSSVTVKLISFVLPSPIDWIIRSTLMPALAIMSNIWNALPGASSTPQSAILAQSLSLVTPLTIIFSTFETSLTYVPSWSLRLERTDSFILYFLAISTHLLCSTFAPSDASSSISSYEISFSLYAVLHILGSVV